MQDFHISETKISESNQLMYNPLHSAFVFGYEVLEFVVIVFDKLPKLFVNLFMRHFFIALQNYLLIFKKNITIRQIKFFMNGLIIFIVIMGSGTVLTSSYELFFKTDEIDILRVDVPLNRPIEPVTLMFVKNILQNL